MRLALRLVNADFSTQDDERVSNAETQAAQIRINAALALITGVANSLHNILGS